MSQNQKTRSKLVIDAVATGAAAFAPTSAVAAISKVKAIAGLAGFVLRLFRSKEPLPAEPARVPRRTQEGNRKETRGKNGLGAPLARRRPATLQNGGTRHG